MRKENPWVFEIEGESQVLETLQRVLSSNARIQLHRISERRYQLGSSDFDSEIDQRIVRSKGDNLIRALSGWCRLELGTQGRLATVGISRLEDGGPPTQFVFVDETIRLEDKVERPNENFRVLLELLSSGKYADVEKILRLWNSDLTFRDLIPILDVIRNDVGGMQAIAKRGWTSMNKLRTLSHTAQSPAVLGDDARHGVEQGHPPEYSMSLEEAREIMGTITRAWLKGKIQEHSRPVDVLIGAENQSTKYVCDALTHSYRWCLPGAGLKILRGQPRAGSRLRRFGYWADWSGVMHPSDRCQTTANHDRTGPITTDFDSNKVPISRGCCCVVIDGDRPVHDMKSPARRIASVSRLQNVCPLSPVAAVEYLETALAFASNHGLGHGDCKARFDEPAGQRRQFSRELSWRGSLQQSHWY